MHTSKCIWSLNPLRRLPGCAGFAPKQTEDPPCGHQHCAAACACRVQGEYGSARACLTALRTMPDRVQLCWLPCIQRRVNPWTISSIPVSEGAHTVSRVCGEPVAGAGGCSWSTGRRRGQPAHHCRAARHRTAPATVTAARARSSLHVHRASRCQPFLRYATSLSAFSEEYEEE